MLICGHIEESNMHLCPNWHNISQNLSQEELDYLDYDVEDTVSIDWTDLGPSLVVYAVTFVMGILGNVLILVAVIRNTQFLKSSPVNVFLGSLASADLLLISICLPLKVCWTTQLVIIFQHIPIEYCIKMLYTSHTYYSSLFVCTQPL